MRNRSDNCREPADAAAQIKEMVLDALEEAGGEEWLRKHGREDLIPNWRLVRMRRERERSASSPENSGS